MRSPALVGLVALVVGGTAGACSSLPASSAPIPLTSPQSSPTSASSAGASADASVGSSPSVELPDEDWSNPDSDPILREAHDEACRSHDELVTAEQWATLVRVVEQQRSGWPFHLYWDGGTLHVACYAPPYDLTDVAVSVVDWAGRDPPGRRPGFATFESVESLPRDERRMGWGTAHPLVAEVRVAASGAPALAATTANAYFVVQWPLELGEDRNAPRLEAFDSCGERLFADDTRTPCPAA